MRDVVRERFPEFTARFEGRVPWMYLDILGLVTTGVGNLIDPVAYAIALPWLRADGSHATNGEIQEEWIRVKGSVAMARLGGGHFAALTQLRLTDAAIDDLVRHKLDSNDLALRQGFGEWDSFPANAQLAIHSMAWAMGAEFGFPRFRAAANVKDWAACVEECHMDDSHNPGLRPRNAANKALFLAAAAGGDPDELAI